jgi:hypothetical protein
MSSVDTTAAAQHHITVGVVDLSDEERISKDVKTHPLNSRHDVLKTPRLSMKSLHLDGTVA